jgi:hypothetical protein
MKKQIWYLVCICLLAGSAAFAVDCSKIEESNDPAQPSKFAPVKVDGETVLDFEVWSSTLNADSGDAATNEIRRPAILINEHGRVMEQLDGVIRDKREYQEKYSEGEAILTDSGGNYVNVSPIKNTDGTYNTKLVLGANGEPLLNVKFGTVVGRTGAAVTGTERENRIKEEDKKFRKGSIGIFVPSLEPPPVIRKGRDLFDTYAKIFKNVGNNSSEYPYIVKVTGKNADTPADMEIGAFYALKDVKYTWTFEKGDDDDDADARCNKEGTSGAAVWTPFLSQTKLTETAIDFIPKYAKDEAQPSELEGVENKAYVNRHLTAFDSGIGSMENPSQSKFLQMVMMSLSYKYVKVTVEAETGAGYPSGRQNADPSLSPIDVTSTVKVTTDFAATGEGAVAWKDATVLRDLPAIYKANLPDGAPMWTLGGDATNTFKKGSAYHLLYVEDYKEPDAAPVDYEPGEEKFFSAVVGGTIQQDIVVKYENPNENLDPQAQEQTAKLKYYIGNNEIYKVDNPFYQLTDANESVRSKPFLNFVYLKGNSNFGPYVGPVTSGVVDFMKSYYTTKHQYWMNKEASLAEKYVDEKLANGYPSTSIPSWHRGVVFYAWGTDGGERSVTRIESLNDAWRSKDITKAPAFNDIKTKLSGINTAAGKAAYADLLALEAVFADPVGKGVTPAQLYTRSYNDFFRFSFLGYDPDKGSFCYGPMKLEKDVQPQVFNEKIIDKEGVPIVSGEMTIHKERVLMPACYCSESQDQCDTDLFTTSQSVQVVVANCCGAVTTVTPGVESTRQGMDIKDTSAGSLPMPTLSMTDGKQEADILVPANYELANNEALLVKDDSGTQAYTPHTYNDQFDLTGKEFFIDRNNNGIADPEEAIKFSDNENAGPGDMVVNEDERVEIRTGGYDNIDGTVAPFQGIGKIQFQILNDKNQKEVLEFIDPKTGKMTQAEELKHETVTYDFANLLQFDPKVQVFHIFRNPGTYKGVYTVWEATKDETKRKSRTLTFNIKVLDIKQQNRNLENRTIRQ